MTGDAVAPDVVATSCERYLARRAGAAGSSLFPCAQSFRHPPRSSTSWPGWLGFLTQVPHRDVETGRKLLEVPDGIPIILVGLHVVALVLDRHNELIPRRVTGVPGH